MATTDKTTLKNWFKNKLKPTQEQFWAWMDSFWHKDESIPTAKIENLDVILNSKATTNELTNLSSQVTNELDGMEQQLVLLADDMAGKVDIEEGKQLSTEDYTSEEKTKLAGLYNYEYWKLSRNQEVIKDGLYYNWYAAVDARGITSGAMWVPSSAELVTLMTYTGGNGTTQPNANDALRKTGESWSDGGGTDIFNFSARGVGYRDNAIPGVFVNKGYFINLLSSTSFSEETCLGGMISSGGWSTGDSYLSKSMGASIRLVRDATADELLFTDGTYCGLYVGNDGRTYRTVKIGTQVWLAENLAETKFANGDDIVETTDGTAFVTATTAAMCAWENDWSYTFEIGVYEIQVLSKSAIHIDSTIIGTGTAEDPLGVNPETLNEINTESNLAYVPSPDNGTVTNNNGSGFTIPLADDDNAGLMAPALFRKFPQSEVNWISSGTDIRYSKDAVIWNISPTTQFMPNEIACNGAIWVAVGGSGYDTLGYSIDGINWTTLGKTIFTQTGNSIAWNGEYFLAVGSGDLNASVLAKSYDGVNWAEIAMPQFDYGVSKIAWNGSYWLVGGSSGDIAIYKSNDGENWIPAITSFQGRTVCALCWDGEQWLAGVYAPDEINVLWKSNDGITWSPNSILTANQISDLKFNGRLYVAAASPASIGVIWSEDAITWHLTGLEILAWKIAWNGDKWSLGDYYSFDGKTWTYSAGQSQAVCSREDPSAIPQRIEKLSSITEVGLLLSSKVDKVEGKQLSTNDYSNEEKAKVQALHEGTVGDMLVVNSDGVAVKLAAPTVASTLKHNGVAGSLPYWQAD